ncbi:hypothetical protein ACWEKR_08770 [Nocardia sp. NPDC004573]|uniref:hypothetical protein n=1 Tax=Nocardia TaxID=1817 RepID=UPI0002FDD302|nr:MULTISPECIES: hypothetical protein [Nocardia]
MSIKILLIVIAVLLGVIIGMVTALLAKVQGAHAARAIRDAGVGFVGTVTLTALLMDHLDLL